MKVQEVISLHYFTCCVLTKFYSEDLKEENNLGEVNFDVRIILN
jgi:uncharacterized protein YebE (UPF0316 family)